MNWTVPEFVAVNYTAVIDPVRLVRDNASHIVLEPSNAHAAATGRVAVEARMFSYFGSINGMYPIEVYDAGLGDPTEATFERVYGDAWRVLFEPSPPVAARIANALGRLGLEPGGYVAAHVRSKYNEDKTGDAGEVQNAIHCALSLKRDAPVYLASDSADALRFAAGYGRGRPEPDGGGGRRRGGRPAPAPPRPRGGLPPGRRRGVAGPPAERVLRHLC
jgi:hypothetical protein